MIQMEDNCGLNLEGGGGDGEEWLETGPRWKVEPGKPANV